MSRSRSDSATTGGRNSGYQSTGSPVAREDEGFPGAFRDELAEVVGLRGGELAHAEVVHVYRHSNKKLLRFRRWGRCGRARNVAGAVSGRVAFRPGPGSVLGRGGVWLPLILACSVEADVAKGRRVTAQRCPRRSV